MDNTSPDLDAQAAADQDAPGSTQSIPDAGAASTWPPMGQITWPRLPAALDAIMTGPQHPSYGDPLVRPWIDLMTPHPLGPGVLDEGLKLLAAQSQAGPASAGTAQDQVSRFEPQTINGVNGVNVRVMTPDETGASAMGDPSVVTNALSRLPPPVLQNLRDKGVRWIVVPDSADQGMPEADLTSQRPAGWPAQRDPNNPDSKLDWGDASSIAVSPTAKLPSPNSVIIGTNNHQGDASYNVTLHETGNSHDFNNGQPSTSPAFRAAYEADAPNMTGPQNSYFLQQPEDANADRARREAYAEGFARYYGGDNSLHRDWPAMYQYWQDFDAAQRTKRRTR